MHAGMQGKPRPQDVRQEGSSAEHIWGYSKLNVDLISVNPRVIAKSPSPRTLQNLSLSLFFYRLCDTRRCRGGEPPAQMSGVPGWDGSAIVAQKDPNPLVTLPRLLRLSFPGKMVGQEPRKGWHVEILPSLTLSSDLHTPLAFHCSGGEISNSIQLSYLTSVCATPYSHVVGYCACSVVFDF